MTGPVLRVEAWRSVPGMRPVRESYAFRTVDRGELRGSRLVAAALPRFPDPAAVRRFLDAVVVAEDLPRLRALLASSSVRVDPSALQTAAAGLLKPPRPLSSTRRPR